MSDNKNTEMAKRVEQAKKKILQEREDMKKGAIKLTAKLLKGIKYEEEFPVKLVNGQIGLITIRPLAEEEMITIFDDLGLDRVSNMGQGSGLSLEDYEFFWSVVAASSGFDKKIIKTTFAMGESAAVGQRILEISGMIETAPDEVEKFLKE